MLCGLLSCTTGLKTSRCDACLTGAFLLVQQLWSCSNGAQRFLGAGGAVLQRAVLVNSVLCREAMLLGRIMEEEEEEAREKKQGWKGGEAGNLRNHLSLLLSLSLCAPSLLFLFYCTLMFCPSFPFLSLTVTLLSRSLVVFGLAYSLKKTSPIFSFSFSLSLSTFWTAGSHFRFHHINSALFPFPTLSLGPFFHQQKPGRGTVKQSK